MLLTLNPIRIIAPMVLYFLYRFIKTERENKDQKIVIKKNNTEIEKLNIENFKLIKKNEKIKIDKYYKKQENLFFCIIYKL